MSLSQNHAPQPVAGNDRVQQLEDRIAELEEALGMTEKLPRQIFPREMFQANGGFSYNRVQELLGILMCREFADKNAVYDCMYGTKPEADQPPVKILDIFICHARKMLRSHGIEIETIWGRGWRISAEDKIKFHAIVDDFKKRSAR